MTSTRREFTLGLLAASALPGGARAAPADWPALDDPPLRARAAAKGMVFGSAVQQNMIAGDPRFADAVLREAAIVTPEFELKWASVRPSPGVERFDEPDALLAWCGRHDIKMRGHALVWHEGLPRRTLPRPPRRGRGGGIKNPDHRARGPRHAPTRRHRRARRGGRRGDRRLSGGRLRPPGNGRRAQLGPGRREELAQRVARLQ